VTVDGARHDTAGELAALLRLPHRYGATRHFAIAEADGRISGAGLFGNALLSRLPIGPSRTVAMPMAPTTAFVEPPGSNQAHAGVRYADADDGVREPRCLLLADIDGLAIGVTHLSHIGSSERELQAAALYREFGDGPSLLLGDLNAPIEARELAVLRDGWTDAFTVVGVRPGDVPRITTEDGARIDHVLVREMEVVACRRVEEAGWLSDHLPVTADLRRHRPLP
jgi:endonuclease/exonuclease/phosphatase family metal-dependent hydrolase